MKILIVLVLIFLSNPLSSQDTITTLEPVLVDGKMSIPFSIITNQKDELHLRKKGIRIAIWGEFSYQKSSTIFHPRVPLSNAFIYELVDKKSKQVILKFKLKTKERKPSTFIKVIYPQDSILPQNLLRFHILFSTPMLKGQFDEQVKLINMSTGKEVKNIFIKGPHEIWNEDRTQLSLYLDPGRIKSGLGLQKLLGLPLKTGQLYQLEIAKDWKDVYGNKLFKKHTKVFTVNKLDKCRPDKKQIIIKHKNGKIILSFNEPINQPQISKTILIQKKGISIKGNWTTKNGRLYVFTTKQPLEKGRYKISISSELEDLAGNSFRRLFEHPAGTTYTPPYSIQKSIQIN